MWGGDKFIGQILVADVPLAGGLLVHFLHLLLISAEFIFRMAQILLNLADFVSTVIRNYGDNGKEQMEVVNRMGVSFFERL